MDIRLIVAADGHRYVGCELGRLFVIGPVGRCIRCKSPQRLAAGDFTLTEKRKKASGPRKRNLIYF